VPSGQLSTPGGNMRAMSRAQDSWSSFAAKPLAIRIMYVLLAFLTLVIAAHVWSSVSAHEQVALLLLHTFCVSQRRRFTAFLTIRLCAMQRGSYGQCAAMACVLQHFSKGAVNKLGTVSIVQPGGRALHARFMRLEVRSDSMQTVWVRLSLSGSTVQKQNATWPSTQQSDQVRLQQAADEKLKQPEKKPEQVCALACANADSMLAGQQGARQAVNCFKRS
jgi:hypothetical protein